MNIPFFRKKDFFSPDEKNQIVSAIGDAERRTSGEVRVYVESHCKYVDPVDRAAEVFWFLKMEKTAARNGVLIYVAVKDRQLAVLGDQGIHEKVGIAFWNANVAKMLGQFGRESYAEAIVKVIGDIGEALASHFPYDGSTDKNELPDDIVFGR